MGLGRVAGQSGLGFAGGLSRLVFVWEVALWLCPLLVPLASFFAFWGWSLPRSIGRVLGFRGQWRRALFFLVRAALFFFFLGSCS